MGFNAVPFHTLYLEPTRNGLTKPKAVRGLGTKMVNMGELFANDRISDLSMDRVPLTESERERSLLCPGDLLFARQSLVLEGAGKCSIFVRDSEDVTFESHVTRVRLNKEKANPLFYYYYFRSPHGRNAIASIVEQGAGASGIRGSDLSNLSVLVPPKETQTAIAHILGTLDDKIELNRRTNETLEAMARAIFKSWFVDFDPVKAKAAGQKPFGMDDETAALFPSEFEDSELGPIPKGWRVGKVMCLAEQIFNGGTPNRGNSAFWECGTVPWMTSGEIRMKFISSVENKITEAALAASSAKWIPSYSTCVALYGATAGQVGLTCFPTTSNQAVCAIVPKNFLRCFNFFWLSEKTLSMENLAVGAAQQNISKLVVENLPAILAPQKVLERFEALGGKYLDLIFENSRMNQSLAQTRNLLLPKLLSGEIEVSS